MSNDGGLIEAILSGFALGVAGTMQKPDLPPGKRFSITYVSGHPSFPLPDDAGSLIIGRDKLHYLFGTSPNISFQVPRTLIHSVQTTGSNMLFLRLQGDDEVALDLGFQGEKRQIKGLVSALGIT